MSTINYNPAPTALRVHQDVESDVKFLMGPVGAGKTVAMIMEMFFVSLRQEPDNLKRRRTRWLVVRNTFPELKSTVIKTFEEWLGGMAKVVYDTPIRASLNQPLADGTTVEIEFVFLALDDATTVKKLRSLEVTAALISEASEINESVVEMMESRIARYPKVDEAIGCKGATWSGILMESNPPSVRSWLYRVFEIERPTGYRVFKQPPALLYDADTESYVPNPDAENVQYQSKGYDYWLDQLRRARPEFINVYLLGQYGATFDGKPVWPRFSQDRHVSNTPLETHGAGPLVIGMDFGLMPAAAFTQLDPMGQMAVLAELSPQDLTLQEFIEEHLIPMLQADFPNYRPIIVGDPTGGSRSALAQATSFQTLQQYNLVARPAPTNDPDIRIDAVDYFLQREGGFIVDPKCSTIIEAMLGGYRYKKRNSSDMDSTYKDRPEKNKFSHPADALQYAALFHRLGSRSGTGQKVRSTAPRKKFLYA